MSSLNLAFKKRYCDTSREIPFREYPESFEDVRGILRASLPIRGSTGPRIRAVSVPEAFHRICRSRLSVLLQRRHLCRRPVRSLALGCDEHRPVVKSFTGRRRGWPYFSLRTVHSVARPSNWCPEADAKQRLFADEPGQRLFQFRQVARGLRGRRRIDPLRRGCMPALYRPTMMRGSMCISQPCFRKYLMRAFCPKVDPARSFSRFLRCVPVPLP